MNQVLITGAAGFIGASLSAELLDTGIEICGVDCLNHFYDPSLKKYRLEQLLNQSRFSFIEGDLLESSCLAQIKKKHHFQL